MLKATQNPYSTFFATKKDFLSLKNDRFWDAY